jgi:polysaccharide biosynthesis/export protein
MRIILAILLTLVSWTAASAQALRAGDTISISVYQDPKLDRNVLIGPTGMISFPLAGQIRAGGLTPAALESVLRNRLKDKFTEEPDITVALVAPFTDKPLEEDLKPRIFVTGEVLRPGFFIVRTRTNVLQALALAGGFGPYAAKRRIQVRRQISGTEVMFLFDYVAFHSGRNVEDNIDLLPGDVVIIPERGIFE